MNTRSKYPIGIQTFEKIIEGGYSYVDKTELVYKLTNSGNYFFLSRPRRFGKSLLLSTIQAYFEGRKELFKGLDLESLETEWCKYPVLLLSLSSYSANDKVALESIFDTYFTKWEGQYEIKEKAATLSMRFHNIIQAAHDRTGDNVVILIDEYDAPMLAHLEEPDRHEQVRNLLKSIYVNIKDMDAYIRFAMLTGVSRFSRMTIFSGLNNLNDISLDPAYSEICGITQKELESNFQDGITRLAHALDLDYEGALNELKLNYDGYHFTEYSPDIYNPFSIINALSKSKIDAYWFSSGTPTFLVNTLQNSGSFLPEMFTEEVQSSTLSDIEIYKRDPIGLLFQTGYLTIKSYDKQERAYTLGIPNREVREGLSKALLAELMGTGREPSFRSLSAMRRAFREGDVDEALSRVQEFLAGIPYELANNKPEIYFENNMYLLFNLIGIDTYVEWRTARGRADVVLEMPRYIYVMELKLDGTAQEALNQIEEKGYARQFAHDGRRVVKIGINFSRETRNIDTWTSQY